MMRRSEPPGTRIIVFCGTKRMCDQLAMNLSREYRAAAIHGDKKQQERDAVLAAFKVSAQTQAYSWNRKERFSRWIGFR
jgi:superfamily II DNA/RNA helicase